MAIDLHNYEAYLLDYFEGRLTDAQLAELQAFVVLHPELNIDLSGFDLPYLAPTQERVSKTILIKDEPSALEATVLAYVEGLMDASARLRFEKEAKENAALLKLIGEFRATSLAAGQEQFDRNALYRDRPSVEEELVLRYREGLMSAQERLLFEERVTAEKQLADLDRDFAQCELLPDLSVEYPGKERLLKETRVVSLWLSTWRVAAAVLLIAVMASLLWPGPKSEPAESVAASAHSAVRKREVAPATVETVVPEETQLADNMRRATMESVNESPVSSRPAVMQSPMAPAGQTVTSPHDPPGQLAQTEQPAAMPTAAAEEPVRSSDWQKGSDAATSNLVQGLENLAFAEEPADSTVRRGFFERVAHFAQQFGKLGFRGVQANRDENSVSLSFNELTVEKKYARL